MKKTKLMQTIVFFTLLFASINVWEAYSHWSGTDEINEFFSDETDIFFSQYEAPTYSFGIMGIEDDMGGYTTEPGDDGGGMGDDTTEPGGNVPIGDVFPLFIFAVLYTVKKYFKLR
jgi:hypothetical protein